MIDPYKSSTPNVTEYSSSLNIFDTYKLNENILKDIVDTSINELYIVETQYDKINSWFNQYEVFKYIIDKLKNNEKSHQYLVDQAISITKGEVILYKSNNLELYQDITYNTIINITNKINELNTNIEELKNENYTIKEENKNLNIVINQLHNIIDQLNNIISNIGNNNDNDSGNDDGEEDTDITDFDNINFNGDFKNWEELFITSEIVVDIPTNWMPQMLPGNTSYLQINKYNLEGSSHPSNSSPYGVRIHRSYNSSPGAINLGSKALISSPCDCNPNTPYKISGYVKFDLYDYEIFRDKIEANIKIYNEENGWNMDFYINPDLYDHGWQYFEFTFTPSNIDKIIIKLNAPEFTIQTPSGVYTLAVIYSELKIETNGGY